MTKLSSTLPVEPGNKVLQSAPADTGIPKDAHEDTRARPWKEGLAEFKCLNPDGEDVVDVKKFEERYNSVATG
jgi:hypothetical protein